MPFLHSRPQVAPAIHRMGDSVLRLLCLASWCGMEQPECPANKLPTVQHGLKPCARLPCLDRHLVGSPWLASGHTPSGWPAGECPKDMPKAQSECSQWILLILATSDTSLCLKVFSRFPDCPSYPQSSSDFLIAVFLLADDRAKDENILNNFLNISLKVV